MLAALEVDGTQKAPLGDILNGLNKLASRLAARCKLITVSCTGYKM